MLAFRKVFYDDADVTARQQKNYGDFDWFSVLRAQSTFCPFTRRRYRTEREKLVTDPSENEIAALEHAGAQAGEYLDSLPSTDLAKMDEEQYMTMIEVICSAFQDKLAEIATPPSEIPS